MRISVVMPAFFPATVYGGPIYSVLAQCVALAERGIDVAVSTTNANGTRKLDVPPGKSVRLAEHLEVKYYNDIVIGRMSLSFTLGIWSDVRQSDVVHVQDIFSTYIPPTMAAAKIFAKPVLMSPRGVLSAWSLGAKRSLAKRVWLKSLFDPLAGGIWWHATSEQEKQEILALYPRGRIVIVPNGLDLRHFDAPEHLTRRDYMMRFAGIDTEPRCVIVSMGRLHGKKGFDVLIDAFSRLRQRHQSSALLIAGGNDGDAGALRSMIERLDIGDSVFLVGHLEGSDKAAFLANADLFALCSRNENFGNVVVEALASGLPVVASREMPWSGLEARGCGRSVDVEPEALCHAMAELLLGDARVVSERAKEYAAEFNMARVGEMFAEVYKQMLEERH